MTHDETREPTESPESRELRARLRALDPAASLPPAPADLVSRLVEETMTNDPAHEPSDELAGLSDESRSDGFRRRSRFTWVVAAAAVVIVAVVGGFALDSADDDPAAPPVASGPDESAPPSVPEADEPPTSDAPTVTTLSADAGPTGRCMVPTADALGAQTLAFDGTVESIAGGLVTLAPTTFYAGDETDRVTIAAPGRDLQLLLSAVDFEEGERYLVSATDGRVTLCGFSAEWSKRLAGTYTEAFAG